MNNSREQQILKYKSRLKNILYPLKQINKFISMMNMELDVGIHYGDQRYVQGLRFYPNMPIPEKVQQYLDRKGVVVKTVNGMVKIDGVNKLDEREIINELPEHHHLRPYFPVESEFFEGIIYPFIESVFVKSCLVVSDLFYKNDTAELDACLVMENAIKPPHESRATTNKLEDAVIAINKTPVALESQAKTNVMLPMFHESMQIKNDVSQERNDLALNEPLQTLTRCTL